MNPIKKLFTFSVTLLLFNFANQALAQSGVDDCFACHDKKIVTKHRTIPNMKEKWSKPFSVHNSFQCTDCHITHEEEKISGGNHKKTNLLVDSFPFEKHAAYIATPTSNTYALCFRCHNVSMLDRKFNDADTNFYTVYKFLWSRQRINAHYSHVVKAKIDGRPDSAYSCAVCHDVHGSDQARNIRPDALPGHTDLRFKIKSKGGSCAGSCHQNAKYDRGCAKPIPVPTPGPAN